MDGTTIAISWPASAQYRTSFAPSHVPGGTGLVLSCCWTWAMEMLLEEDDGVSWVSLDALDAFLAGT
jgi:hypothetical protein